MDDALLLELHRLNCLASIVPASRLGLILYLAVTVFNQAWWPWWELNPTWRGWKSRILAIRWQGHNWEWTFANLLTKSQCSSELCSFALARSLEISYLMERYVGLEPTVIFCLEGRRNGRYANTAYCNNKNWRSLFCGNQPSHIGGKKRNRTSTFFCSRKNVNPFGHLLLVRDSRFELLHLRSEGRMLPLNINPWYCRIPISNYVPSYGG
jgi:hypothetical protein